MQNNLKAIHGSMFETKVIKIGNKVIGSDETFIIAEIGSNHNKDIQLAYDLIDSAKECGADAIKFQTINLDELYYEPSLMIRNLHKKIDIDEGWHYKLKDYSDKKGIIFFSSPTYLKAIDILEDVQIALYKLASAQIGTFPQIIERVAKTLKPTLISTGLVAFKELEKAVKMFRANGNNDFVILHCNSIYPTPYEKVNLGLINVYKAMFNNPVGFSDHTLDIYISIAAVSIGAKVIEKHFTLNRNINTPDAQISLEPIEFKRLVEGLRDVEKSLKYKERIDIEKEEEAFKEAIIYRLIINKTKNVGDAFAVDDFVFKRHYEGIDCREMDYVLKYMKAKIHLNKGMLLNWNMLEGK